MNLDDNKTTNDVLVKDSVLSGVPEEPFFQKPKGKRSSVPQKAKSTKELIESKESPTAANLSIVEKNIVLGEYPNNTEGSNRLYKKTDTTQDAWINFVILAIQNGRDPYRQTKSRVHSLSQAQLHHHAKVEEKKGWIVL
jgi:hypothetical protein